MPDESPLRILAVCSRPLIDAGGHPITLLDVAEERRRVEKGVERAGDVARVHFLPEATTGGVKSALREGWDVVHFTGHGTGDGRLALEDGYGVAHLLSKRETAQLFTGQSAGQKTPLVVLSTCYSETVARELHAAGVPAVVAVDARVPIHDLAAIIFAEHFYSALAKGWQVKQAFDEAQQAVALDPKVGDKRPPKDEQGNDEEPWSKRFLLIGDAEGLAVARGGAHSTTAQAPPHVAGNLRAQGTNFVGRAKEIVDVVKAFDQAAARRVCIYGLGGVGKTELAKAVARWYSERGRVGGVLWASAGYDEAEYKVNDVASLLGIAARVFRLPITEQSGSEEQKSVVREFLAANRALLILDNWETVERQHRRQLWDFTLGLPDTVRVLVTSRDVMPAREARNIELDTLAPDDASSLFLNIARNAGYFDRNLKLSAEELAILHSICERLGGYPLAIEMAAGQTLSRTITEIWEDLQRLPSHVLKGKDEITGEPRSVWSSLDLSYNALPANEQSIFCRMCVFLAPTSAEDVAAITKTEAPRPALDALVKRSLVRMREGAYVLPLVVRDYAEDKLVATGLDPRELHARAVSHYGQKNTLEGALMASEHLFELATRFDSRDAASVFVEYVSRFYPEMIMRGYWAEARRKTEQLISAARVLGDKVVEAQAIAEQANILQLTGEYRTASELYQRALEYFETIGDRQGVATILHQLGSMQYTQGNYPEAETFYKRSLEIKRELEDKQGQASTLHQLGVLSQAQGDYAEAARLYAESLAMAEELGDRSEIAATLNNLGMLEHERGDYEGAYRHYSRSLGIAEELGDKRSIAASWRQLGLLAKARGDYEAAMEAYQKSVTLSRELGDKLGLAIALSQFADVLADSDRYPEAAQNVVMAGALLLYLQSPYLGRVEEQIRRIRHAVGDEQFERYVKGLELKLDEWQGG